MEIRKIYDNSFWAFETRGLTTHKGVNLVRSGQVWGHTPEQRVAASTLGRYSLGLRLAIAQADARTIMPISLR